MSASLREIAGDERRAAIVTAALAVFAESGYKGSPLATIAERAGLTQQGILYHFQTKEQLLIAALQEADRRSTELWMQWYADSDPAPDYLDLALALVERNTQNPGLARLHTVLAADSVTTDHPAHAYYQARYASLREHVGAALTAAAKATPALSPAVAIAVLDGLQLQWLMDPTGFDMAAEFRSFIALARGPEPEVAADRRPA